MPSTQAAGARRQTIIRRRVTQNFSVIDNAVFDDERISLDALGVLGWLRSRPANWQVWPRAIAKRFKMGRDKTRRIFNELIETGWVHRTIERAGDGTFEMIVYYVYDQPVQPQMQASVDDDGDDDGEAAPAGHDAEGALDSDPQDGNTVALLPQTAFPAPDDPAPVQPSPVTNNDKILNSTPPFPPGRDQTANWPLASAEFKSAGPPPIAAPPPVPKGSGPPSGGAAPPLPSFAEFIRGTGAEPISRQRCERRWLRLSDQDHRDAASCWGKLAAERAAKRWKLPDPATYLRDRMWERYLVPAATPKPASVAVRPRTPAFHRWIEHYARTRGPFSETLARRMAERDGVLHMPSEFPPGGPHPRQPQEELRAAVLLIALGRREDKTFVARNGSDELRAWTTAAATVGRKLGLYRITDFSKPIGDPERDVFGCHVPARWPPGMAPGDAGHDQDHSNAEAESG